MRWLRTALAILAVAACAHTPRQVMLARQLTDNHTVLLFRNGLRTAYGYALAVPAVFSPEPRSEARVLTSEERSTAIGVWRTFLDYLIALDGIADVHLDFQRLPRHERAPSFLIAYAARVAQQRFALEFIRLTDNSPEMDTVLNEAVPEMGLPAGTYAGLKFQILNVARGTEFVAFDVTYRSLDAPIDPALREAIDEDAAAVWKQSGKGPLMTLGNGLAILKDLAHRAIMPAQTSVSTWMGDTKVYRTDTSLISEPQIEEAIEPRLQPGDILLERREWYLSNIGLPGYWSHAALYIGTPEERHAYFDDDDVRAWLKERGCTGDLEAYLAATFPTAYENQKTSDHGHPIRLIEAMSEGVVFTSIEHSASCDALAVLRPRLSKREVAAAIARSFSYAGRPYDFNFDFVTDDAIVCTELVAKSYEPSSQSRGLKFPLLEILGRKATPANEMAHQFDEQFGTAAQQSDLVLFFDSDEGREQAYQSGIDVFRKSWTRPKWYIFTAQ